MSRRFRAALLAPLLAAALACGGSPGAPRDDVAVRVARVALDPVAGAPVIILQEDAGSRRLPIWIGVAEARSIAQRLEEVELPRPNTHDLAKRLVEGLEGSVERVTVTELREGTYYAVIALRRAGHTVQIDSRPSDAIALALRTAAPVFVREALFEEAIPEIELPPGAEEQRTRAPHAPPARTAPASAPPDARIS